MFTFVLDKWLAGGDEYRLYNIFTGVIPQTQLNRHSSKLSQIFSQCCLHKVLSCTHMTKSIKKAAVEVGELAVSDKYEGNQWYII